VVEAAVAAVGATASDRGGYGFKWHRVVRELVSAATIPDFEARRSDRTHRTGRRDRIAEEGT
jgi:hypothetical protein